jgi:DHA1 family tetracycline resistance protein-like MFS transporter
MCATHDTLQYWPLSLSLSFMPIKNKALLTIFLIVFIDLFGFGIILPLLPFIAEKYGATPLQIGLLASSFSFFQFISSPILGRLSDRFGRKKLLIISQIGTALGFIVLGVANSLPLIFLSRIIDGVTGGNISIAQAYIADVTTEKQRVRGMGLISAAFGMGFIFGPAVSGLLAPYGYSVPAYFAAGISVITVLTNILFLKESVNTKKTEHEKSTGFTFTRFKEAISHFPIGILIAAFFVLNLSFSVLQGVFAIWTQHTFGFGARQNGFLFTYIGVIAVLTQLFLLPFLSRKIKETKLLIYAIFVMAFGFLILPLDGLLSVYIALLIIASTNGIVNPTVQSLASKSVHRAEYGGTLGIFQSVGSLGRIFGPSFGGTVYDFAGVNYPFFLSSILIFASYWFTKIKLKRII